MYLLCRGAEEHMSTANSGVATLFEQFHKLNMDDSNPKMRKEEYLGWIEEILELHYGEYYVVLLAYNWMKARYMGLNPIIVQDKYGFTSVNFSETIVHGLGPKYFSFFIHVQQVFYCKDGWGLEWKNITKVEVRGCRGDCQYVLEEEGGLFNVGHDFLFEGLSPNRRADRVCRQIDDECEHVIVPNTPPGIENVDFESNDALLGDSSKDDI